MAAGPHRHLILSFLLAVRIASAVAGSLESSPVAVDVPGTVRAIAEDADGFVWLGTDEGLFRFDGFISERFEASSIASVAALAIGPDGSLLIASVHDGLLRYDPLTRSFTSLISGARIGAPVTSLACAPDGRTVLGTNGGGVVVLAPDRTVSSFEYDPLEPPSMSSPQITAITVDTDTILAGTVDRGLNVISSRGIAVYRSGAGNMPSDRITALASVRSGEVAIGLGDGTVGVFGADGSFRVLGTLPARVAALAVDADGAIWAGTRLGATRFRTTGSTVTRDDASGIPGVRALAASRSGVLAGTDSGALRLRVDDTFETLRLPRDPYAAVPVYWSLAEMADGTVFAGTERDGLIAFVPGSHDPIVVEVSGLEGKRIVGLGALAGGLLVAAGDAGAYLVYATTMRATPVAESAADVATDAEATAAFADGGRYVGSSDATLLSVGADGSARRIELPARSGGVRSIARAPDGALWIGTGNAWVLHVDPEHGRADSYPLDLGDGAAILSIRPRDDGTVWAAADRGGIVLFDPGSGVRARLVPGSDLPARHVYAVVPGSDGSLWFTTDRGLGRLDIHTGDTETFTEADGLRVTDYSAGAIVAARDGRIYAGGVGGVTRFDPREIGRPSILTVPRIAAISTDAPHADRLTVTYGKGPRITLRPPARSLEIVLGVPQAVAPDSMLFQTRASGEWSAPTRERTLRLESLRPGDHEAIVRATTVDRASAPLTISITVIAAIWQRTWFVIAVIAVVLAALAIPVHRAFARRGPGIAMRPYLDAVVGETVALRGRSVRARVVRTGETLEEADAARFGMVVTELVSLASRYPRSPGIEPTVHVELGRSGADYRLVVTDNARAIPSVFAWRRNSAARRVIAIVARHRGSISIRSGSRTRSGQGNECEVRFPADQPQVRSDPP